MWKRGLWEIIEVGEDSVVQLQLSGGCCRDKLGSGDKEAGQCLSQHKVQIFMVEKPTETTVSPPHLGGSPGFYSANACPFSLRLSEVNFLHLYEPQSRIPENSYNPTTVRAGREGERPEEPSENFARLKWDTICENVWVNGNFLHKFFPVISLLLSA